MKEIHVEKAPLIVLESRLAKVRRCTSRWTLRETAEVDLIGHVVNFRNTIIILTSNAGTKSLRRGGGIGFTGTDAMEDFEKIKAKITTELRKIFNPEFLNRLDDTIIFNLIKVLGTLLKQT